MSGSRDRFSVEETYPIPDTRSDLMLTIGGEPAEILVPQSRRELHLVEGMREAGRDHKSEGTRHPFVRGFGAGTEWCIADKGETVATGLCPVMLITMSGNMSTMAFLDAANSTLYVSPEWEAVKVDEWIGGIPDAQAIDGLLTRLLTSPVKVIGQDNDAEGVSENGSGA